MPSAGASWAATRPQVQLSAKARVSLYCRKSLTSGVQSGESGGWCFMQQGGRDGLRRNRRTLYALYKQATEGDSTGPRPGGFDFKAIAKYDAWHQLAGLSKDAARQQYVELVAELAG
uniref:ACB domain-containing protein n=1 Tax=Tanacetum cinerariifolium TaxID=118510 RepID=A0A699V046_TANCI|nr:hypothetical protein [Tanacetum cinerariifolium]